MLEYDDLATVPAGQSAESLLDVRTFDSTIIARHTQTDMTPYTGNAILVRETVAQKLSLVNQAAKARGLRLCIVYGYRHPDIQRQYYDQRLRMLRKAHPYITESALIRITHAFTAVPSVAGHPAGAAVDLTLVSQAGQSLQMGTRISDFSNPVKIPTFSTQVSKGARANRILLHDLLVDEGFAPFYGEWWHFSFGDREWAVFYNQSARYDEVDVRIKGDNLL
ncbi:MAG: D-alanyl-D-alanine carboxypeptidase family protein [Bifidobacteriaceae bacterium]|nr:D-alanyl-D-alanine carboxypeptidase family protein [Bifidobacteriaceae bacterium]